MKPNDQHLPAKRRNYGSNIFSSILLTIVFIIAILQFGCEKEKQQTRVESHENSNLSSYNSFRPSISVEAKANSIKKLAKLSLDIKNNSLLKNTGVDSVALPMARWQIETTLNSIHANVYDSSLHEFVHDTLEFEVDNIGIRPDGTPVINQNKLAEKYLEIEQKVNIIEQNDSTIHLFSVQISNCTSEKTNFRTILSIASSPNSGFYDVHYPIVLNPWESPTPFPQGTLLWPLQYSNQYPYTINAVSEINKRLNAHKEALLIENSEFIIERGYPNGMYSFVDIPCIDGIGGRQNMWHANDYMDMHYLNADELNYWMSNYKSVLDYYNTPFENPYVMEIIVTSTNTYRDFPPPSSYEGWCWYHFWHNLTIEWVFITAAPPSSGS